MGNGCSIGPITGLLKPKYRTIQTFLGENYSPMNGLDVFLDLNTLVDALSGATGSSKFMTSLPFSENVEADIISNLLLTLKHWKDFTRKWSDVRLFMIVNDFEMGGLAEQEVLKAYLAPYIHKFHQDRFKQFVYYWTESLKRVEVVLKYVPNAYMIRCNRFDAYVIPEVIDDYTKSNSRDRIIVSGSSMFTNYCYMPNAHVIYTKYKCQLSDPLMICQSIAKIDDDIMKAFTTNRVFYNLLNMIIGDKDRAIIGLTQIAITNFAMELMRSVEQRKIPENPKSIEAVLPVVNQNFHDQLRRAYPLVDISTHAKLVPQSMIEKVKSNMVDLYDIDGLRALNINGLNLLELL